MYLIQWLERNILAARIAHWMETARNLDASVHFYRMKMIMDAYLARSKTRISNCSRPLLDGKVVVTSLWDLRFENLNMNNVYSLLGMFMYYVCMYYVCDKIVFCCVRQINVLSINLPTTEEFCFPLWNFHSVISVVTVRSPITSTIIFQTPFIL